jgi:hypothetical protein
MVSASPMASLPPGPASVLPEPGTTGITLALPGYSWKLLPALLAAKNFEPLPVRPAGTGFQYAERTVIPLRTITVESV